MKNIICCLCILICSNHFLIVNAQNDHKKNKMYLLMAASEDHVTHWDSRRLNPIESDSTKPAILFLLNGNRLKIIDTINYDFKINTTMQECRHFEEFGFFYIRERENFEKAYIDNKWQFWYDERNFVSVLDYSEDTIVIRKAVADSIANNCVLFNGGAYLQEKQLAYTFSRCDNQKNYNRNIINRNLTIKEIREPTFYADSYVRSECGLYLRNPTGFPFNKMGKLVLSFYMDLDITKWAEVEFQFPYKIDSRKYANTTYLLKTPLCNKEILFKRLYNGATDSVTAYYIYDKNTRQLDSILTEYTLLGMNLYENKIGYGAIALNSKYTKQREKDLPSPSRYSKKFGFIPNLERNTGKFYLWNLHTNNFKIYSFDDLDTELLSIHEDWVYFRKFDELRRISLSNLDNEDYQQKTELLYQDRDIIPHIHQVFWAPELPVKVEWVRARPNEIKN